MTKRERLENLVEEEFRRMGKTASRCELRPAVGHWRTDIRADVYRFEGQCLVDGRMQTINSWVTMTDLLKTGITLDPDNGDWLVNPKSKKYGTQPKQ